MTQAQVTKLGIVLADSTTAATLVAAGYEVPADIKNATDGDLLQVIDAPTLADVRVILPENP